jgi:two-component system sensor histidine kinase PilS (NtrC family)
MDKGFLDYLNKNKFSKILLLRSLAYLVIVGILIFFGRSIIPEDDVSVSLSQIYGVVAGVILVQFLFLFVDKQEKNLFFLTILDVCVATYIIKSTGATSSPFQVLLPLLSLVSSVHFSKRPFWIAAIFLILLCIPVSIGFRATVAGISIAVIITAFVGLYLRSNLEKTGVALSQTQAQQRRLESLQKAIMANIPSGLLSVDSRGQIIQANKIAAQVMGLAEKDLVGKNLESFLPELNKLRAQLETRTSISDMFEPIANRRTISFTNSQGKELRLGYSLARLSSPDNHEILGTLILFQDLTDAINMEENLKLSEKLAAVGKLAAGIAHEIRNPLAGISGAAQLLEADHALTEENQKLLSIIQRESSRLDSLISEFLEFVRPTPPKQEAIQLTKIAEQVVESLLVNPKWKSLACKVHLQAKESQDAALGDENRIAQVLLNLVLNAGQAGAKDVWIEVMEGTLVRVLDNGPGIPDEIQARIFEPFFTTKDRGTGLGLAIAYKTLEGVGASINLKSPVHEKFATGGTLFEIQFKKAGSRSREAA